MKKVELTVSELYFLTILRSFYFLRRERYSIKTFSLYGDFRHFVTFVNTQLKQEVIIDWTDSLQICIIQKRIFGKREVFLQCPNSLKQELITEKNINNVVENLAKGVIDGFLPVLQGKEKIKKTTRIHVCPQDDAIFGFGYDFSIEGVTLDDTKADLIRVLRDFDFLRIEGYVPIESQLMGRDGSWIVLKNRSIKRRIDIAWIDRNNLTVKIRKSGLFGKSYVVSDLLRKAQQQGIVSNPSMSQSEYMQQYLLPFVEGKSWKI